MVCMVTVWIGEVIRTDLRFALIFEVRASL